MNKHILFDKYMHCTKEELVQMLLNLHNVLEQCVLTADKPLVKKSENWNPDWKGDPDDPARWRGW